MSKIDHLFEIIAGTYEEFLLGYKLKEYDGDFILEQSIASHSHKGSLRTVATSKNLLASGGTDETIYIYDLVSRKETGILMHHTGTVTCLSFTPDDSYLMSASEDGSVALVRVGNWMLEKVWSKAHKGSGVSGLSIHPSAKLALTVGSDKTLRTWNLIKGRQAYAINLARKGGRPDTILWSCEGNYYVLPYECKLEVYSLGTAGIKHILQMPTKVTCVCFIQEAIVCVGEWNGELSGHSCKTGEELWRVRSGESRVKAMQHTPHYLVTANSQGTIHVYDTVFEPPKMVTSVETSCRVTCLALSSPHSGEPKKKAKKNSLVKEEMKENGGAPRKKERKLKTDETPAKNETSNGEGSKRRRRKRKNSEVICTPTSQKWKVEELS